MAELVPYPFGLLVRRMFAELDRERSIFGLPQRRFYAGPGHADFGVLLHGRRASSPIGPAAGPHTQLAQNIVLAWLAGARVFELKTVQVLDRLTIPRPCIDMRTIGYNAEWSQELTVEQSLAEYVKASMLIAMLRESGRIDLAPGFGESIFDMSVGYDLAGIRSPKVTRFLDGMRDAQPLIDELRREIPVEHAALRDLPFERCISGSVTLSTFHGCPPGEIESIALHLMRGRGLNCVVKLNPTLLGPARLRVLLHDVLGYRDVRVPDEAFDRDTTWIQAEAMTARLLEASSQSGAGFGVKFTNTLVVENTAGFLPEEQREVYLSGAPLHVLAVELVAQFRSAFGDAIPLSFSAGIDAGNCASAVALGLAPVTVCTDLLRAGGYGRLAAYHAKLEEAMGASGAATIDDFVLRSMGSAEKALAASDVAPPELDACVYALADGSDLRAAAGDLVYARWVSAARLLNTARYAAAVSADDRYAWRRNSRPPTRVDRSLGLFDCITCDKCIPVCPNAANFAFTTRPAQLPRLTLRGTPAAPVIERGAPIAVEQPHQIATFAGFCNECGNCDVFCPESGAPYAVKPLFFGSDDHWRSSARDGFYVTPSSAHARIDGDEFSLARTTGGKARFTGRGFDLELDLDDPEPTVRGNWSRPVPLTWCYVMDLLQRGVLDPSRLNFVNLLWSDPSHVAGADSATMPSRHLTTNGAEPG